MKTILTMSSLFILNGCQVTAPTMKKKLALKWIINIGQPIA